MSQILNSAFLPRSEMEFGRMFNPYLHKGSENFDLALSVPDSSHHSYMTDQGSYGSYESGVGRAGNGETYTDMSALTATSLGAHDPPHTTPLAVPQQHTHPQAMYQMGVVGGGLHGGNNPQFPPQNLYIPPISQHGSLMAAQTTGYVGQGLAHNTPVYTSAALGLPTHNPPHPMMATAGGMMHGTYYQRPPGPRSGGSPNSGGSPSPGSDDSDDSTQIGQGGRGKRPSPEAPTEPPPAKGKKARVSKKSKKKKDPNEPQKPVSAYALFFRDTQAAIKGQNPNASFGEVSKIVASMWDALDADSKGVYKKKTEAAKKEYLKALAAYRASLVSKGGEGDQMFQGPGGQPAYPQFGSNPSYGFPPSTNAGPLPPPHAQGHSSPQLSPLAKKSPLLSSLMNAEGGQQSLMNPPMSQPMPPSAPSMMTHGPIPTMNPTSMGPQGQTGNSQQVPHQPGTPTPSHLNAMSSVPPTSPYITQNNPSLGSPVSSMNSDVGSPGPHTIHKPTQQPSQPQQSQQQQQTQQQQSVQPGNSHPQQTSPQHQGHHSLQQHGSNQGGGHPTSGPNGLAPCNVGSCIRAGCTNPAVHNPEWEDEYCSNECVVSHCRDVFNSWVASGQGNAPTYPAPVK